MSEKKRYSLLESNSETAPAQSAVQKRTETESSKKASKKLYIIFVVAISVLLSIFICAKLFKGFSEQLVYELRIEETDLTGYEDGIYEGTYVSSHLAAVVQVTIIEEKITSIVLTQYSNIDPARASVVFDAVIKYQMLNTPDDDIGTQITDIIVLKAIENSVAVTEI